MSFGEVAELLRLLFTFGTFIRLLSKLHIYTNIVRKKYFIQCFLMLSAFKNQNTFR